MGPEALKIKAPTGMPAKKAKFNFYKNQQLSFAIALGAFIRTVQMKLRTAAAVLCISQSLLTLFDP